MKEGEKNLYLRSMCTECSA